MDGIEALYATRCPECGGSIRPGMLISQNEDGAWCHVQCLIEPPSEKVCERCWLVHPEGACDR